MEVLSCYDRDLSEREAYPAAADCDFVLVTLRRNPIGRPMSTDTVRKWLAALSRRAELDLGLPRTRSGTRRPPSCSARRGCSSTSSRNCSGTPRSGRPRRTCIPDDDALRAVVDRLGGLDAGGAR